MIPESSFQKCFEDWKKRWLKCIILEGGYFEKHKIVIDKYFLIKIENNDYFIILFIDHTSYL